MSAPLDRLKGTCLDLSFSPDRYAHAGEADPKVLLTTSRDPSSRLVQFAKVVGVVGVVGGLTTSRDPSSRLVQFAKVVGAVGGLTTSRDPSSRLVQFAKASGEAPGAVCIHTFVPRMHTYLNHAGKQAPVVA
jgi:hypothetical protein